MKAGRVSTAESAVETNGAIQFRFPNGFALNALILDAAPEHSFAIEYIGGCMARFELAGVSRTDLTLTDSIVPDAEWEATLASWQLTAEDLQKTGRYPEFAR